MRRRAATSCGSTWRTPPPPTRRSASTAASCATGYENVGVVLQAHLRRTLSDVEGLGNVRLCKGIYVEPLELAFHDPDEIRGSFLAALDALLDQGSYVGDRDPRRAADPRVARAHRRPGPAGRPGRVPDAARRPLVARRRARPRGPPAARLHRRSGRTGTSTRFAGSRRTRSSPATSPPTRCGAFSVPRLLARRVVEAPEDAVAAAVGAGSELLAGLVQPLARRASRACSRPAAASCPA